MKDTQLSKAKSDVTQIIHKTSFEPVVEKHFQIKWHCVNRGLKKVSSCTLRVCMHKFPVSCKTDVTNLKFQKGKIDNRMQPNKEILVSIKLSTKVCYPALTTM